jgi:small subunit ribosomal protein S6
MKTYEVMFIVRSSVGDEDLARMIEKIRGLVEKNGGAVLKAENWGKRKLAYEIKREKRAAYLLFLIKGDGKLLKELEQHAKVEESLIRFMAVVSDGTATIAPAAPAATAPSQPSREAAAAGTPEAGHGQLQ